MLFLVVVVGLFLLSESRQRPCATVDDAFGDWLSMNAPRPAHREFTPLTLFAINDNSVANGHPMPWDPVQYALFPRAILPFSPEVVAIDEVLDWKGLPMDPAERQKLPQYETMLSNWLLKCPKLLLAARLGWPEDPENIPPIEEAPLIRKVKGDIRPIPEWTVIEQQPKDEFRLTATTGFTNIPAVNGPVNSVPLLLRYRGEVAPSFVLQAILLWQKLSTEDVTVEMGSHISLAGKMEIPIGPAGEMRVNFGALRTRIAFDDLLLANEQIEAKQKPVAPVDRIKGGIALLARTDAPSRTIPLAMGKMGSEGELFSAAIATIQEQVFIKRAPYWFDFALIGVAALFALRIPRWRKGLVAAGALLAIIVYTVGALAWFSYQRVWVPGVLPAGLAIFVTLYRMATPNFQPQLVLPPVESVSEL